MCLLDFDNFIQMLGVIESSVVSALQQTEEKPDRHHKVLEG